MSTTIHSITRTPGIAGQSRITANTTVTCGDSVYRGETTFVGNYYGAPGPVVLFVGSEQVYVTEPARFGERFDEAWVRAFFAPNVCGSPVGWINQDEYCVSCERDNREGHYENCAL